MYFWHQHGLSCVGVPATYIWYGSFYLCMTFTVIGFKLLDYFLRLGQSLNSVWQSTARWILFHLKLTGLSINIQFCPWCFFTAKLWAVICTDIIHFVYPPKFGQRLFFCHCNSSPMRTIGTYVSFCLILMLQDSAVLFPCSYFVFGPLLHTAFFSVTNWSWVACF